MDKFSSLRKERTRQKQRSEPQNSLQEQLRSQVLSPTRFYGATGRRENPGNEVGFRKSKKETRSYWKGCKDHVSAVIVMNIKEYDTCF